MAINSGYILNPPSLILVYPQEIEHPGDTRRKCTTIQKKYKFQTFGGTKRVYDNRLLSIFIELPLLNSNATFCPYSFICI